VNAVVPQKPWRFSATAAEMAADCMYAFSQRYELGTQEIPGRPLHVGRLLAMTVERYQLHCFEQRVPSDVTEILAIARKVYAEAGQGAGLDVLDEVLRVCEQYVESFNLDLDRLAGVEMWLPPAGIEPLLLAGREVVGKVDQLGFDDDGRLAIVTDQKSNWAVPSEHEIRQSMQSRLYPVLIFHSFPDVEEVEIRFEFIRWGQVRIVRFTRAEAELERQKLEALSAQMQKPGARPATPGERCAYCGYVSVCPVFKTARASGVFIVPTNEEEAHKVHETVLVLKAGLDQRRAALRAFTKEHGPIETGGERAGYFVSESRRVLAKKFREWAPANGIDPDEFLVVPPRELEQLMKKRKSLEPITWVETHTKFSATKKTDPEEESSAA
jgi:hypothetical protein